MGERERERERQDLERSVSQDSNLLMISKHCITN